MKLKWGTLAAIASVLVILISTALGVGAYIERLNDFEEFATSQEAKQERRDKAINELEKSVARLETTMATMSKNQEDLKKNFETLSNSVLMLARSVKED